MKKGEKMYVAVASVIAFVVFIGVFIQMMFIAPLSWGNLSLDEFIVRSVSISLALSASAGIAAYMYLNRGEKIYIAVIVIMLPGIMLFYLFNIPFIPPASHLDPFNRFIMDNWLIISIISIEIPIITAVILRILGDEILVFSQRLK